MIPVLFDSANINTTLGKGKLSEIISCTITEDLNGEYSLEFTYPITGHLYKELLDGGTVQVIGPHYTGVEEFNRGGEWFDIYKHSLAIDGVVTFYCQHISRRLQNLVFKGTTINAAQINRVFTTDTVGSMNGLSVYTNGSWTTGTATVEPKSALAVLIGDEESFASVFGGEFAFESHFISNVPAITIFWKQHRGKDNGVQVRYGFNMTDIEKTWDETGTYNAVVPFWDDGNGNKTYVSGYIVQPTTPITPIKARLLDCTDAFQTQPTEAQLTDYARDFLDNSLPWIVPETLTVDMVNGAEIDPHGAGVSLGDTLHVFWGDADVSAEMEVVSYRYDVLEERYAEMTLGTPQTQYVAVTGESYAGTSGGGGGGGSTAEWVYVGESQGTTPIQLPQDDSWSEVFVKGLFGLNGTVCISDNVPKSALSATEGFLYLHGSFGSASDYHVATLSIKPTEVALGLWQYNGSNVTAQSRIKVWVR